MACQNECGLLYLPSLPPPSRFSHPHRLMPAYKPPSLFPSGLSPQPSLLVAGLPNRPSPATTSPPTCHFSGLLASQPPAPPFHTCRLAFPLAFSLPTAIGWLLKAVPPPQVSHWPVRMWRSGVTIWSQQLRWTVCKNTICGQVGKPAAAGVSWIMCTCGAAARVREQLSSCALCRQ